MVRYLDGITSNAIIPLCIISNGSPINYDNYFYYCIDGSYQNNVTQFVDYMECCGVPLLDGYFNSTMCDITNTDPCPLGIVGFQSSSPCSAGVSSYYTSYNILLLTYDSRKKFMTIRSYLN